MYRLLFWSIVCLAAALLMLTQVQPRAGIPSAESLKVATGIVAGIERYKYGVRFGLVGTSELFNYPSKSNAKDRVEAALRSAGTQMISVRYEAETFKPIYSEQRYHNIWEISVGGTSIRTYTETSSAQEQDNKIAPWLGAIFGFGGIFLGLQAYRGRKA